MVERETKEIEVGGHKLVIYTYLTGREARALRAPYLKQASEFPAELIEDKGLKAAVYETVENLTLKTLIVSFDGKKDGQDFNLLDTLLSLPSKELKEVVAAINGLMADPDEKKVN